MPGTIMKINVAVGAAVKKGDVICVLEAMKMENDIVSPVDGTVASINVTKGASVNTDEVVATIN
jgi:biotin carboxyl carrier protein